MSIAPERDESSPKLHREQSNLDEFAWMILLGRSITTISALTIHFRFPRHRPRKRAIQYSRDGNEVFTGAAQPGTSNNVRRRLLDRPAKCLARTDH